jgi:hypothetical protein
MIRAAHPSSLPFDPLDLPFGESRLPHRNPTTDVALSCEPTSQGAISSLEL